MSNLVIFEKWHSRSHRVFHTLSSPSFFSSVPSSSALRCCMACHLASLTATSFWVAVMSFPQSILLECTYGSVASHNDATQKTIQQWNSPNVNCEYKVRPHSILNLGLNCHPAVFHFWFQKAADWMVNHTMCPTSNNQNTISWYDLPIQIIWQLDCYAPWCKVTRKG